MSMPISTRLTLLAAVPLLAITSISSAQTTDTWRYSVGVGAIGAPKYPGSKDTEFKVAPLVSAAYGRFFVGAADVGVTVPMGIGYYLINNQHWKAGIAVGYDIYSLRKESDDREKLQGLGDIERTVRTSVFGRYTNNQFSAFGAVVHSAKGQGFQVKLGADMSTKLTPSLIANAGPSMSWGNERSNQVFYGVSPEQSARSGISAYKTSAGVTDVTFTAGLTYLVSPNWRIGSRVSIAYLPSDISDSPIVEKSTSMRYGLFTSYSF
jgi:outer membrane protein